MPTHWPGTVLIGFWEELRDESAEAGGINWKGPKTALRKPVTPHEEICSEEKSQTSLRQNCEFQTKIKVADYDITVNGVECGRKIR